MINTKTLTDTVVVSDTTIALVYRYIFVHHSIERLYIKNSIQRFNALHGLVEETS